VTTKDLHNIDWAAVAARARADLGNELVAHFSERLRTTMIAYGAQLRPAEGWGRRFGDRRRWTSDVYPASRKDLRDETGA
jgi:hypothetical protein